MTMKFSACALAIGLGLSAFGGAAAAKPALKDVTYVREGIITAGMAYELSEKCGNVSARLIRGVNYLYSLRNFAKSLGYTSAEIDAYVDDKAEENRLAAIARARLADKGTVAGQEATYCAVALAEMSAGSAVGNLLR